jgi:hypothetical protein
MSNQLELPLFNGADYVPAIDHARLSVQFQRIFDLMKDGKWRTLAAIAAITKDPPASISAQLRHMRKERFGAHTVNRQRTGEPASGLFEYQLVVRFA